MKIKRKNRSVLFRGTVLALAMSLCVLCFPVDELVASAAQMKNFTDYTFMTVGTKKEAVETTVTKGGVYTVPHAYIGGNKSFDIGGDHDGEQLDSSTSTTLKSSKITVKYSSEVVGEIVDGTAKDGVRVSSSGGAAEFDANKVGAYTVTYSYTYTIGGVDYTNSYDMTVTSEITDADISFESNEKVFLPSILDLSQAKKGDSYKDMYLPLPKIADEDGKDVDTSAENSKFEFVTDRNQIGNSGKKQQVLIQVSASTSSTKVEVKNDGNGYYIAGSTFGDPQYGAGKYTVTYSYFEDGQFIASTTKETQVYSAEESYYKDYALSLRLESDFVDNGQTGVESTLPSARGVTASATTPSNEQVDVYYTVTVYYRKSTDSSYKLLDKGKYNASVEEDEEKIVNDDGTLVNPTKFKPLDDGYYSFVYEAYDYYYDAEAGKDAQANKAHYFKTDLGRYEYKNITDEKAPTPVVYRAKKGETQDYADASADMATRAGAESVVIYAIGIDDNVSKTGDEGVVLTRKIMTDETVAKITLSSTDARDLSDWNLIFNYAGKYDAAGVDKHEGRVGLKNNNYLIRTQMEDESVADTEKDTLAWLKENKYLIVVDKANYTRIYENFKDSGIFDESVTDAETALKWFDSDAGFEAGFAYIDCDQTFGSSAAVTGGMGVGQYYIHYIAQDAAKNETDIYKRLYVRDFEDLESPDITFSTSLKDSYLPDAKITFNAPTVSDNIDENMTVHVMYRYLDKEGSAIEVTDDKEEVISNNNLTKLWKALGANSGVKDDDGVLLTTKYAKYHTDDSDKYVDITDTKATTFTIDLNDVKDKEPAKLQIIAYAYDDSGNATMYGQTIEINTVQDSATPQLMNVTAIGSEVNKTFEQGATITLPSVTVADDAVGYMTSEVKVDYIDGDGERYARSVRETKVSRVYSGAFGKYTVNAGEFVAAKDGKYQMSVAVKDAKNNTIVVFANFTVTPRAFIQDPVINSTLTSQEVELDDHPTIEIPTPIVNFELGSSVTEDVFLEKSKTVDETYVVRGLNADGKATNWSIDAPDGRTDYFTPTSKGVYELTYTVTVEAYDHTKFTYKEMTANGGDDEFTKYEEGGYYTNSTALDETTKIYLKEQNEYKIITASSGNYLVRKEKDEEGKEVIKYYSSMAGDFTDISDITKDDISDDKVKAVNFEDWFNKDLRFYKLESETYTITVKDSRGPQLTNYDYSDQSNMTVEDFKANGIKIYGIEATDASGINADASSITLSWKRANGTAAGDTGSHTYSKQDALKDNTFKSSASNLNGTYTISYDVYDNNGQHTTATYTVHVGDFDPPKIVFVNGKDNLVKTTYGLKDKLVIDLKDIKFTDNNELPEDAEPVIKLVNTSKNNEEVAYTKEGTKYIFESFEEHGEGSYKLTIEIEDAVGHVTTEEITFSVATANKETTETYKIVGTVLIVISVLVLAGVIIYFIVSKVKLDKELKK